MVESYSNFYKKLNILKRKGFFFCEKHLWWVENVFLNISFNENQSYQDIFLLLSSRKPIQNQTNEQVQQKSKEDF